MWFFFALTATVLYSCNNVVDSAIVHRYKKNSIVVLWSYAVMVLPVLICIPFFVSVQSAWAIPVLLATSVAYIADLCYLSSLKRFDVSITIAGLGIFSVVVSVGAFLFLGETWSVLQWIGAALTIFGIFLMAFWHKHVHVLFALAFFTGMGIFYAASHIVTKAALLQSESVGVLLYWYFVSRMTISFLVPLFLPSVRKECRSLLTKKGSVFFLPILLSLLFWFFGKYFSVLSYEVGHLSLTIMVGNAQPFFVIFVAWMLLKIRPSLDIKELLTKQSVVVKLVSFSVVFGGLALLVI